MTENNQAQKTVTEESVINCHTHIFTGDHVPPWLAKTFLPFPFYYLFPLSALVRFFRWWYRYPAEIKYKWWYKKLVIWKNNATVFLRQLGILRPLLAGLISVHVLYILLYWFMPLLPGANNSWVNRILLAEKWLREHYLLYPLPGQLLKLIFLLIVLLFIPSGRNLILFLFKKIWSFIALLPGKQTTAMFRRYLNIGRYAFHREQSSIFGKLRDQYPAGTRFVVLPMDMEYMGAGKVKKRYRDQLEDLRRLKQQQGNLFLPFLFADPRRMALLPAAEKNARPDDKPYFDYTFSNGTVQLQDSVIRDCLEGTQRFSGIKIYPALGYYPFDETLLPLWKYAADHGIPVMTHCIRGTIFYRGKKKKEWNRHPLFEQAAGRGKYEPLLLPEMNNIDFSVHFTHPLNYLCLVEEYLLRKWVGKCSGKIQSLFGYTDPETALKHDLRALKICFGHFGGDDEWARYFEKDRDLISNQLVTHPDTGTRFLFNEKNEYLPGKAEQLWRDADWYTLICSMMLQYPSNIYADISYILHSETAILPLLKRTLAHPVLQQQVLFGTDFYVVRNHKSDKQMLADMMGGLDKISFDRIARQNPKRFLNL